MAKDRILVVDDQKMNLDLLVGLLSEDYEVSAALTGEEALALVPRLLPDVILLDIRLPGIDGFEVCRQLKAAEGSRDIGVIFITSLNEDKDQVRGLKLGAADFITKPFNPVLVRARIHNHLAMAHVSRQLKIQLRKLEEAQKRLIETEKQAVLGQLITGVAHELNTPMGVAVTGISYVLERAGSEEDRKMLQLVLDSLKRAHHLITDLKRVSAATGGRAPARFDLGPLIKTQVEVTLSESPRTNIALKMSGPEKLMITNHANFVGRILEALVRNSLIHAFHPDLPGRISVDWRLQDDGQAVVVYEDDGRGLGDDELSHLFEPFRGSLLRKESPGLGTFLIRHLATSGLGGTIQVRSQPGQGLRYELTIPDLTP